VAGVIVTGWVACPLVLALVLHLAGWAASLASATCLTAAGRDGLDRHSLAAGVCPASQMRLASARAARVIIREGRNKWQVDQTQDKSRCRLPLAHSPAKLNSLSCRSQQHRLNRTYFSNPPPG
jgi:hypothetical protein